MPFKGKREKAKGKNQEDKPPSVVIFEGKKVSPFPGHLGPLGMEMAGIAGIECMIQRRRKNWPKLSIEILIFYSEDSIGKNKSCWWTFISCMIVSSPKPGIRLTFILFQ